MNEREININTPSNTATTEPRQWVEPTFERIALCEALSGINSSNDGPYNGS